MSIASPIPTLGDLTLSVFQALTAGLGDWSLTDLATRRERAFAGAGGKSAERRYDTVTLGVGGGVF